MPDAPARAASRSSPIGSATSTGGGTIPTEAYAPERYRGILMDGAGRAGPEAVAMDGHRAEGFPFRRPIRTPSSSGPRALTAAEVADARHRAARAASRD